jgi:tyrosyl-tRNA synthetase
MELAFEIVDSFYGVEAARRAERRFRRVVQDGEAPRDMPEWPVARAIGVVPLLVESGLAPSRSAARRLIEQRGVRLDGESVKSINEVVEPREQILQVGRRRYLRLRPE